MEIIWSDLQKKLLNLLIDKYEGSKTYRGENRVSQSFEIRPEQILEQYRSDYADVGEIRDFGRQMRQLQEKGLIDIGLNGGAIKSLKAVPEQWEEYYRILGRADKNILQQKQITLYQRYLGNHKWLDRFCAEQIERLSQGKKGIYEPETADKVLTLCCFLLNNQEDILERELSVALLGDSKLWEQKYRSRVCGLLKKYGEFEELLAGLDCQENKEDKREAEKIILEEYHVFSNPSYGYMKGNAVISFKDGQELTLTLDLPIALSIHSLKQVKAIRVLEGRVMTVENLTSFNRMEKGDTFYIYLGGYHNSVKQKLIRKIYDANPSLQWLHFGDIDPDGFYIAEHLRRGTGIPFELFSMEVKYLQKYAGYTKALTGGDRRKAENLLNSGRYGEVMAYMLETNRKLEQEIISWLER